MKVVISRTYGTPEVLELIEVEKPVPKDNQVLVKVHATSINFGNLALLVGKPFPVRFAFGLTKPKYRIPGGDMAGRVEAVGPDVKAFNSGDEVFADLSGSGWGAFAEYVSVPEDVLVQKPSGISFEEAAAVPMAGVTALQGIRDKGEIQTGQKVLVYGASGGVGTFAVQLAKSFGAEVTAVCSTRNVDLVRLIGADHVIDYKREDFRKQTQQYDLIIGVNGHQPLSVYKRALKTGGRFVHVGGSCLQLFQTMTEGPWISMAGKKKMGAFLHKPNPTPQTCAI
ncbi:NAD(P)-dependent alcohol dehydrogenase [Bacillus tianshenii]|uniref:NAD(P)-dependent alcohol dehydrogenase n=1 Tax=Sutcliffiella tianshenii TaxID=1463404 RepID=UPI00296AB9C7|nr:NAD(P)-dependent alcohol dehydrogenase [Bacillus tianshenii]